MRTAEVERRLRVGFDRAAELLGSTLDPEQRPAADRLAALGAQLVLPPRRLPGGRLPGRRRTPAGVYLHGPVGRGKTWLGDVLVDQLDGVGVLRLHAHEAARELHRGFALRSGSPGATGGAIAALLDGVRLLLLDELHAHDPGDAMLLSRLVLALPSAGAVLVATSNYLPQDLLPEPRHHALVLPLVGAIESHCRVVEVAGPVDHRAHGHGGARPGWCSGGWASPGSASQRRALRIGLPEVSDRVRLSVGGRPLWASSVQDGCVELDFRELCLGTTSVGDVLELADRFRTVVVAGVPPLVTVHPDARRRFADLVDVLWDRDVRLVVLAAGPPAQVLDGAGTTDLERTVSRLHLLPVV